MDDFRAGNSNVGTTWQIIINLLQAEDPPVEVEVVKPPEGATGWSDTWMINSKTKNLACSYAFIDHLTSAEVNAQIAEWFGEAPGNSKSCALTADPNHCDDLPRRGRRVLAGRLVLADADRGLRRRAHRRQVQGLRRLDQGLDRDQGLIRLDRTGRRSRGSPSGPRDRPAGDAMTTVPSPAADPRPSTGRRSAAWLHRHPRSRLGLILALPVGWLVVAYLGSLLVLFLNAFWSRDPFTSLVVREFTLDNFVELLVTDVYRTVTIRTVVMAALVTADLRRPGLPDRVLHGQGGLAPGPQHPGRRGPHAALGELPGQGLLVAADPVRGGRRSTGPSPRSACTDRALAMWPSGSSSPTSGCRT